MTLTDCRVKVSFVKHINQLDFFRPRSGVHLEVSSNKEFTCHPGFLKLIAECLDFLPAPKFVVSIFSICVIFKLHFLPKECVVEVWKVGEIQSMRTSVCGWGRARLYHVIIRN